MPLKRSKPLLAQCKATRSSGEPCKAKPHKGGLCFFHFDPKKAAELGREGGRRNRHTSDEPMQPVAAPESAGDVKRMLAESMAEVRARRMDPKLGTTLAYMGVSLLKAIEVADIDVRLKKLELTQEVENPTQAAPRGDIGSRDRKQPA